jgi:hypothetical protein
MKRIATLLVLLAAALAPGSASAESSTCQAYNPQLCNVSSSNDATSASGATLPFTGLDVGLLAVGGGVLLAAGVTLRAGVERLG